MEREHTHANAIVELGGHIKHLVGGEIARTDEGTVVGGNVGDVAVFPLTELGMAVAGDRICGCGCC